MNRNSVLISNSRRICQRDEHVLTAWYRKSAGVISLPYILPVVRSVRKSCGGRLGGIWCPVLYAAMASAWGYSGPSAFCSLGGEGAGFWFGGLAYLAVFRWSDRRLFRDPGPEISLAYPIINPTEGHWIPERLLPLLRLLPLRRTLYNPFPWLPVSYGHIC